MTTPLDYFSKDEYEELRKVFFCEAYELVEDIQDGLLRLEDNPAEEETLIALQRYFHTLKGDSNSIGLTDVGAVCHRIEDILTSFRSKTREIDSSGITLLLRTVDNIAHQLKAGESGSNGVNISETVAMIDGFLGHSTPPNPSVTLSTPLSPPYLPFLPSLARRGWRKGEGGIKGGEAETIDNSARAL